MQGEDEVYLCYTKSSRPTGKNMAQLLGLPSYGIRPPYYAPRVLIRWGSRRPMPQTEIVLNNPEAIALAADKLNAIKAFNEFGLMTVPVYFDHETAARNSRGFFLGRSRRGFGGKDIVIYQVGDTPTQEHDFYVPWIQSKREVRIHVVGDKVVRIQGKYLDYPEQDKSHGMIRNHANGYRFRSPRLELRTGRRQAAVAAVRACGLDFGAVDMLLLGDNTYCILEVNTAPSCSPLTARCYAAEFALLIERRTEGAVRIAPELLEIEDEYYDEEE